MNPDIETERLAAAEKTIQRLEAELRRAERLALIGRLTASVMHEINNPAEAIMNLVYLISRSSENSELVAALAHQAEEQARRIQYVARQTLSYFKEQPARQETDLVILIETALRFHGRSLLEKRIVVNRQLPDRLIVSIFPGEFLQLVSNLLQNAIRALPADGTLCLRLRSNANHIRLTIADNGSGIPEGLRKDLFQPFHTGDERTGHGLGLWICKSVVDRHCGRLAWKSSTGKTHGTTFSISIAS